MANSHSQSMWNRNLSLSINIFPLLPIQLSWPDLVASLVPFPLTREPITREPRNTLPLTKSISIVISKVKAQT